MAYKLHKIKEKRKMTKYALILILGLFSTTIIYSQDFAFSSGDSSHIQKRERVRMNQDTTQMHVNHTDKFIDNDGDGINDVRCGRGMGLGKGLGKHNCVPENCMHNQGKGNQGKTNPGKAKGKNK